MVPGPVLDVLSFLSSSARTSEVRFAIAMYFGTACVGSKLPAIELPLGDDVDTFLTYLSVSYNIVRARRREGFL